LLLLLLTTIGLSHGGSGYFTYIQNMKLVNNIETRAVMRFFFLQGKATKEIHAILTETLACFLPGRANDLSAPLYLVWDLVKVLIKLDGHRNFQKYTAPAVWNWCWEVQRLSNMY